MFAPPKRQTKAEETGQHHCPGRGFRDGGGNIDLADIEIRGSRQGADIPDRHHTEGSRDIAAQGRVRAQTAEVGDGREWAAAGLEVRARIGEDQIRNGGIVSEARIDEKTGRQ